MIHNLATRILFAAIALVSACGADHYLGSPYSDVNPSPTPTPSPTATPRPFTWMPPLVTPFGYSYTPQEELPCGPYVKPECSGPGQQCDANFAPAQWASVFNLNRQCVHDLNMVNKDIPKCIPDNPYCTAFAGRRLTKAEAQGRRAWVRNCYDRFQVVMQQMDVAESKADAEMDPCPLYPEFGIPQPDGSFIYVATPTTATAPCTGIPVTALPAKFCTTNL